jgi:hypothetical protein
MSKKYEIDVAANITRVYAVARSFNMSDSSLSKWLFKLRGLPESLTSIEGLTKFGFVILGDKKEEEMVFGLVGKFWTFSANIRHLSSQEFNCFDEKGYAKAVANIALFPKDENHTKVITETRVDCTDIISALFFRLYWTLISPFSGIVRKEWLKTIKQASEDRLAYQANSADTKSRADD